MSAAATIRSEVRAGVGRLVIDNPARRNAMTLAMWRALPGLVADLERDESVRVVVIEGAGDAFCAGADISEFGEARSDGAAGAEYDALVREANRALFACAKPTVALIRGACFGGGVGLALACDLRVARADARFCVPAARLGLGYPADDVDLLVSRIGVDAAADLLFTARVLDAERARADGLVREVHDAASFETQAQALVQAIAANAPLTLAAAKAALLETRHPPQARDRERVAALVSRCMASADYVEGREAFAQRRPPRFRGA